MNTDENRLKRRQVEQMQEWELPGEFPEWPYCAVEQRMKCVGWKSEMELILSEYLISIRVVDYCSLGLLSKNKIKRKEFPSVNTVSLVWGSARRASSQTPTLTRATTIVNCCQRVKLDVSNTDVLNSKQPKRPSRLMQQHAETLFMPRTDRALKLQGLAEALLHSRPYWWLCLFSCRSRPDRRADITSFL